MLSEILLAGGDARQTRLAELLRPRFSVCTLGVPGCPDRAPQQPTQIVLPCPAFDSDRMLRGGVPFSLIFPWLVPGVTVFAGAPGDRLRDFPVRTVDLLAEDRTVTENARLTAEAALLLVMESTGRSLWKRRCVVVGFGRIGKLLALGLQRCGARVTVLARKAADQALAGSLGMEAFSPAEGPGEDTELVFNTAPAQALSTEALLALPEDCLWVELASAPGGLPKGISLPLSVLPAGGLPGRLLPDSAARVLYDAILRLGN